MPETQAINPNKKRDLIAGIGFIAIAALIILIGIPYGVQEPKKIKFVALSPSYYPRLVCYCLLFIGALLVATRLFKKLDKDSAADHPVVDHPGVNHPVVNHPVVNHSGQSSGTLTKQLVSLTIIAVILLFYYLSLESLGFIVSSSIVLLVLLLIAGERKPWAIALLPALLPVSIYWFFTHVANIPIPTGILEPWLLGA